ncbi:hypothetical protein AB0D56_30370 [Streptomyces sp. NPDC048209]|uniref:hypothetical protein n=1 Tax=Streptomyces sp. NPDC048209 TaxID=3156689 RepID=UPI0034359E3B
MTATAPETITASTFLNRYAADIATIAEAEQPATTFTGLVEQLHDAVKNLQGTDITGAYELEAAALALSGITLLGQAAKHLDDAYIAGMAREYNDAS